jgi:hypothetical protein
MGGISEVSDSMIPEAPDGQQNSWFAYRYVSQPQNSY